MPANLPLIYGFPTLLDRLMDQTDFLPLPAPQEVSARHFPPLQIFEDENALHVRASVPGISLENLQLILDSKTLSLRGVIPFLPGRHLRRDRPAGPFKRDIRLPFPVQADAIRAAVRNGVLTVTLPRTPLTKKRIIPVSGATRVPS
ncbi:Heat shock protein Hsp20 [uncultured delta proteobacterium]|uniref:Heat shock protein Hsp20 n=1 Tax=uncultured delta proteobacterium TaxID=34034 RepID=A0A212JTF3_9DELT|nr:Heat shock protein Hsp20 [uncultured delta proteobacterium]